MHLTPCLFVKVGRELQSWPPRIDYSIKEIRHGAVQPQSKPPPQTDAFLLRARRPVLSDMMPSIPTHFVIAKSEASFVNTQVITDKIQERIKMGKRLCWNSLAGLGGGQSTAEAFSTATPS